MSDIIRLLPDSVANQIAAGEVIQRPASVVKELVENSLDAGASHITIQIKDAGRTLIQVIDNGKGMSETDARMAFERHATSKIRNAEDLFALQTMGFRGEALASIAAVAQVELKSRVEGADLGTRIVINGSTVETQEPISTPKGTVFSVRNLFYNIPARRKFLKSNQTELSHIVAEFERIALANPSVGLTLMHNDSSLYDLPSANTRQRIGAIFGKHLNQSLLYIDLQTPLVNIQGYVSTPDGARKTNQKQFFFVNGRYMRHPYFHKAALHPYEGLLPTGEAPHYFLYLEVDPATIDVNIHPTKTEISFENAQPIWQMLAAAVKETLGKFNEVPSLDFSADNSIHIPVWDGKTDIKPPQPKFDASYNPFKVSVGTGVDYKRADLDWEKLYTSFHSKPEEKQSVLPLEESAPPTAQSEIENETTARGILLSFRDRYVITISRSGLMLIDRRRAHVRVLYDQYMKQLVHHKGISQRTLFPELITLSASDMVLLESVHDELHALGFEINNLGGGAFSVSGIPANLSGVDVHRLFNELIESVRHKSVSLKEDISHRLALALARNTAIISGKTLSQDELSYLVEQLMASPSPMLTPDGQKTLVLLAEAELEKMF